MRKLIWIVCRDKKRCRKLKIILRRRYGGVFDVVGFAKMDDLPRENITQVAAIVISLIGGKVDGRWEIGNVYRRWFSNIPLLVEVEKDVPPEKAIRYVDYGGWHVFGVDENVADVIKNIITPMYDYPSISEVTKRFSKVVLPKKIKMVQS